MEKQAQVFKKDDMVKVARIARRWSCSRQHIYNMIDRGELSPAFRFGGNRGLRVPLPVVEAYERANQIDPAQ